MKNKVITVCLAAKGRLRPESMNIFKKKKLKILSVKGERDLIGYVKSKKFKIKVLFLHARECIDALANGTADISISGIDLLNESNPSIQRQIKLYKRLNFGFANLVLVCPTMFIDCQTMLDVSEIAAEFIKHKKEPLKIGTKYPRLLKFFLIKKNVKHVEIINSKGSTEIMPRIGQSSLVADITSTGFTLAANNLRIIQDGLILASSAALMVAKKSYKEKEVLKLLKLLSK